MKKYCINCKKEIYKYKNVKRCKSCARKGKLNPRYGKHTNFWTEKSRRIMSNKTKGKNNPMFGKKRLDLSLRNKKTTYPGSKNPRWLGGISKLPYSFKFTNILKKEILKRDNYKCKLCKKSNREEIKEVGRKLSIHHIDYNKNNCRKRNLTSLCCKCNSKVNSNRDYWYAYFTYIYENITNEVIK